MKLADLKKIWFINFIKRVRYATRYYNFRYGQIIRWGFTSREDTNYTYALTPANLQYLASTLAVVTGQDRQTILNYMQEAEQDEALKLSILNSIRNSEHRHFADAEVRFARRLGWYALLRALKPAVVVETGVDKGLGSVLLSAGILRNRAEGFPGKFYGTDINPEAGYMLTGAYREAGEILYGDSIESLKKLKEPIGLFINDSDHSADYEYREYQTIVPLLNEQSVILGDNAHATDKLVRFAAETGRDFLFFKEEPLKHWYPGAGIGIAFHARR
jgi:predicted O-methyltransferase YrrM